MGILKKHIPALATIAVTVLLLHIYFFRTDVPFLYSGGDPFDQYIKFQWLLLDSFTSWNFEWSWLHGLGGDLLGEYMYYYATSIFYLVNLFLPISTIADLIEAKLWISVVKGTLAGMFFYGYMVYLKKSRSASLVGVFLYIGSVNLMSTSFYSDFMADPFVFLPLVVWALDVYIAKGKPLFFIVTVFLMIQSNFYFAYNTTIYLMMYTVVVLLATPEINTVRLYAKKLLQVAGAYLLALLLASYSFLPAVYQFFDANRFSKEYSIPLTFPVSYYLKIPFNLFFNINAITIPAVFIILLLAGIQFRKRKLAIPLAMAALLFVCYLIPFMYSMFNGFSAIHIRWVYMLLFAFAVLVAYTLDEWLAGKNLKWMLFAGYYVFIGYVVTNESTFAIFLTNKWTVLIFLLHIILPLYFLIQSNYRRYAIFAIGALLMVQMTLQQYMYFSIQLNDTTAYKGLVASKIASLEDKDKQEVVDWVTANDEGFSRVQWYVPYEEIAGDFGHHNNNMFYQLPGMASYHSLLSKNLGQFIFEDYQIKQFDSFSHFYNVDERAYIQTYLQANYMIVGQQEAFEPAGYTLVKAYDSYNIYELDARLPFAYVETNVVNVKDFNQLSVGQREELLLTAYVSQQQASTFDMERPTTTKRLLDGVASIPEIVAKTDEAGILTVESPMTFVLPLSAVPKDTDQVLASISIEEVDGAEFDLMIQQTLLNKRSADNIYSLPITDFTLHIDEEIPTDQLALTLTAGRYKIEDILIEAIPLDALPDKVSRASEQAYTLQKMDSNRVTMTGTSSQAGMLVTSIPYSPGWKVKVNQQQVQAEEINGAFVGIPLAAGEHTIELTYHSPFFRLGIGISALALLVLFVMIGIKRKRRG